MTQAMKPGACPRLLDAAKARAGSRSSFARCGPGAYRSCRSGSVDCVVSAAGRANDPRQARLLADGTGRAVRPQAVRSRTRWQSFGEPSSGGLPTLRGSCATTEIGVRLDARPGSLSAVLESDAPTPPMIVSPNPSSSVRSRSPPSRAIAWRGSAPSGERKDSDAW